MSIETFKKDNSDLIAELRIASTDENYLHGIDVIDLLGTLLNRLERSHDEEKL